MTASQFFATNYNVSHPAPITPQDVIAAFGGRNDRVLQELLWEAEPESIVDLQIELNLHIKPVCAHIQRLLPPTHPLRVWSLEYTA